MIGTFLLLHQQPFLSIILFNFYLILVLVQKHIQKQLLLNLINILNIIRVRQLIMILYLSLSRKRYRTISLQSYFGLTAIPRVILNLRPCNAHRDGRCLQK